LLLIPHGVAEIHFTLLVSILKVNAPRQALFRQPFI
jgi:hypothetical protein